MSSTSHKTTLPRPRSTPSLHSSTTSTSTGASGTSKRRSRNSAATSKAGLSFTPMHHQVSQLQQSAGVKAQPSMHHQHHQQQPQQQPRQPIMVALAGWPEPIYVSSIPTRRKSLGGCDLEPLTTGQVYDGISISPKHVIRPQPPPPSSATASLSRSVTENQSLPSSSSPPPPPPPLPATSASINMIDPGSSENLIPKPSSPSLAGNRSPTSSETQPGNSITTATTSDHHASPPPPSPTDRTKGKRGNVNANANSSTKKHHSTSIHAFSDANKTNKYVPATSSPSSNAAPLAGASATPTAPMLSIFATTCPHLTDPSLGPCPFKYHPHDIRNMFPPTSHLGRSPPSSSAAQRNLSASPTSPFSLLVDESERGQGNERDGEGQKSVSPEEEKKNPFVNERPNPPGLTNYFPVPGAGAPKPRGSGGAGGGGSSSSSSALNKARAQAQPYVPKPSPSAWGAPSPSPSTAANANASSTPTASTTHVTSGSNSYSYGNSNHGKWRGGFDDPRYGPSASILHKGRALPVVPLWSSSSTSFTTNHSSSSGQSTPKSASPSSSSSPIISDSATVTRSDAGAGAGAGGARSRSKMRLSDLVDNHADDDDGDDRMDVDVDMDGEVSADVGGSTKMEIEV
ncbi:hypothetical protein I317_07395 [Kwoniella heveanensis CBS 569]|nr:hypothetical protein I317_07395 [Kwoniella heveanensis CBS 569]